MGSDFEIFGAAMVVTLAAGLLPVFEGVKCVGNVFFDDRYFLLVQSILVSAREWEVFGGSVSIPVGRPW